MRKVSIFVLITLVVLALPVWAEGGQEQSESEGPVTIKVWNWSQELKDFYNTEAEKFEAEHPNIDVVFETYAQDQYQQTLPLSLKGGSAADVFWLSPEMSHLEYKQNGWIAPIDPYVDDLYLAQFDQRLFEEGVMLLDGEVYTLPLENRFVKLHGLLYYNKDVFEMAGLDESDLPETYSEFRELNRRITEAGDGEFYGFTFPGVGNDPERPLQGLLTTGTPASGDIRYGRRGFDYRDGEFKLDNENHLEVYRLMKGIIDDGSVVPGWSSMKKEASRSVFGENKAAFYIGGTWMPGVWEGMGYEDLNFGIGFIPVPDSGRRSYRYMSLAKGSVFMSGDTEHPEEAAEVIKWLHGPEFQQANFDQNGIFPGNITVDTSDANWYQQRFLEIADEVVKNHPEPVTVNPDAGAVQWPVGNPKVGELFGAALLKDEEYYLEQASAWNEYMSEQLRRNIEKANAEGADVSLEDFIFPDWDPLENY